jgi:Rv0078B-related antitoxin
VRMEGDDETTSERLIQTFEMFEFGVEMMAANLRRRHPDASPEQIELLLEEWLLVRPGAEAGDSDGVPVQLTTLR